MSSINISTSPGHLWWKPAAWLRVTGPDAATFLQGQFTNEIRGLNQGTAIYGLWLSVKGKVLADSFLMRGQADDEFWLASYFSPAAAIRARLESHIIADDVTVVDMTTEWEAVSLWGSLAEEPAPKGALGFRGRRGREANTEWIFPRHIAAQVRARCAGLQDRAVDEALRLRIAAGIPAIPSDIGPGDLPNEGGLESDAISYTKGCYLGQEVMARLKSMGQVRRRLCRVVGHSQAVPTVPADLFVGSRRAGELRSVARDASGGILGLAMLSLLQVNPATALALAPDGAPALRLDESP